jgi:hypothetical protein
MASGSMGCPGTWSPSRSSSRSSPKTRSIASARAWASGVSTSIQRASPTSTATKRPVAASARTPSDSDASPPRRNTSVALSQGAVHPEDARVDGVEGVELLADGADAAPLDRTLVASSRSKQRSMSKSTPSAHAPAGISARTSRRSSSGATRWSAMVSRHSRSRNSPRGEQREPVGALPQGVLDEVHGDPGVQGLVGERLAGCGRPRSRRPPPPRECPRRPACAGCGR